MSRVGFIGLVFYLFGCLNDAILFKDNLVAPQLQEFTPHIIPHNSEYALSLLNLNYVAPAMFVALGHPCFSDYDL